MIRLMNESSSSEDKIRTDIDNIVKNGGDAYDAMDYLESNGFIEGISTTMKHPDGSVEITTFYNDKNGNGYVAIDHTPLHKGNEVIKVWFGYNESIKRSKNNKRSIKEGIGDQEYYLKRFENYKDYCQRIVKLANSVESLYGDIGKYLEQANLNKSYLDRIGKLYSDTLDAWAHIDQAEVLALDLVKDFETFIEL